MHRVYAPDYLKDLSTGTAHTLLRALKPQSAAIILARDTKMAEPFSGEAFGLGNTQYRPWLRDTVWLLPELQEPGVAMAHELFHILANNGRHSDAPNNLMQSRTSPAHLKLSGAQCQQAREQGLANGLLQQP